jgi:hypothetical protein
MIEKGVKHPRPSLVSSMNLYTASAKDIEMLSKDKSMNW